ncbi:MAG: fatty acid cis/trans isomerase, partial [Flavobacteriales bacterium]|nr:fatty acid cis/trans isomerase [Flavobacteriales bacterium]
ESEGFYDSENDLTCSETEEELMKFFEENPHKGMPFGFPELEDKEYSLLMTWLNEGAKSGDVEIKKIDSNIEKWETFLNNKAIKNQVMSRYIYEHLFIAHIYFPGDESRFYELVRSKTPPNEPLVVIATRYPFDAPESDNVYYRLREITSTIVDKTHMVYEFSDSTMKRYESLFLEPKWNEQAYMPSYDLDTSANPFLAFKQIPAKSRYEFLLDNSYFFISTFIKGPVCNGQIALDVINDHFWVMFLDPEYDLSVTNKDFLENSFDDLSLPNQEGSNASPVLSLFNENYHRDAVRYYKYRDSEYSKVYKDGPNLDFLWKDDKNNSSLLTVYRHYDSGSLHKGALGDLPRTLWVIDYPLLERIYYSLVAGFDVFGNTTHQLLIRQYMNRLRIEGESNFLYLLPSEIREETFDSWYLGTMSKLVTHYHETSIETGIDFKTDNYKEELALRVLDKFGLQKDRINYSKNMEFEKDVLKNINTKEDIERAFSYLSQNNVASNIIAFDIKYINLAHIRIRMNNSDDLMYSMVVNRWHDNVSFMFNEELRLDAEKDKLNFIEGFVGSYPNIYLDIKEDEIPEFFNLLSKYSKDSKYYNREIRKFSVNRSDDNFWYVYDWFQNRYNKSDKLNAGLFDLNRYYPIAD